MNAPLQHRPLGAGSSKPLAPSLERQRLHLCLLLMILDGLALLAGFLTAGFLHLQEFPEPIAVREVALIAPMFLIFGFHGGFYRSQTIFSLRRSCYICLYSTFISSAIFLFITFYTKSTIEFSRVIFTLGIFISGVLILVLRWLVRLWVRRAIGPSLQNTLIIHAGGPAIQMDHAYHVDAAEHGLAPDITDPANLDRVGRYMENMDRVVISCDPEDRSLWVPLLRSAGVRGEFVSDALHQLAALKIQTQPGFTSVVVSVRPLGIEARVVKRLMDITLSSLALLLLSPLMIAVAILIKLEDGGPVLFRQLRMGRGNRFFWIYKFRSMRVDRGDASGTRSAARDDDRTTRIGRFIRRTSIDELPQLFNVWWGEMSLVGPRPHALGSQAGSKLFWEVDGRYWDRHVLKPGMTGLAQIRGYRGATECEKDLTDRLQADREYISNWSLWLDLLIIARTCRVLVHSNAF